MLTKLSQWVAILFCSLFHGFLLESHYCGHFRKARWCSLLDINFKILAYVITPHQVYLSKMIQHWDSCVSHCREEALATHELAMRRIAERRKNTFTPSKKGDKVWLDTRNIKTTNNPKIRPQHEGPFKISDVLGPLTYWSNLPTSWWIHNIFHAILLQPYIENKTHGANFPQSPPELLGGEEVYKVESIIRHQWRGQGYQYLVKWKGYLITDATWENKSAFSNDGDMLSAYKDQHQL